VANRSEWCISRQRVWGVPIPSLHHSPTGRAILDTASLDHIINVLEEKGAAYWWDGPVEEFLPPHLKQEGKTEEWKKGSDTMDVWFDSGTSWSLLRGSREDAERDFDADVCLEGSDQHRGWFQSMLLTAVGSSNLREGKKKFRSPYGTLITHGMVMDEEGKKMSKSKGNIISPMMIVNGGVVMSSSF
jgi:isoleucyl-tRNA synthetase